MNSAEIGIPETPLRNLAQRQMVEFVVSFIPIFKTKWSLSVIGRSTYAEALRDPWNPLFGEDPMFCVNVKEMSLQLMQTSFVWGHHDTIITSPRNITRRHSDVNDRAARYFGI